MINATNGVVLINDKNIQTHSDDVRHLMGLCPQHNLLFPDLTVEEHLRFFAKVGSGPKTMDPLISFFFVVERFQ